MPTVIVLGEIVIATIDTLRGGIWYIKVPGSFLQPHMLEKNQYTSHGDAVSACRCLVPEPCCPFLRVL